MDSHVFHFLIVADFYSWFDKNHCNLLLQSYTSYKTTFIIYFRAVGQTVIMTCQ